MARWEPDPRRRLVEAAVELFGENGYDKTGVAEISARAGLTKTTFFRHFRDKREVLFAGQETHNRALSEAVAEAPDGSAPAEQVSLALAALAGTFPPDHHIFAARLQAVIAATSELQERSALKRAGYAAVIATALRERGVGAPAAVVSADLGMLAWDAGYAAWIAGVGSEPLADLVERALEEMVSAAQSLEITKK